LPSKSDARKRNLLGFAPAALKLLLDPKFRCAGCEIHREAAMRKHISANEDVVWRIKGNESYNISLNIADWQREADAKVGRLKLFEARMMKASPSDHFQPQFDRQGFANSRAGGASVDLGEGFDSWATLDSADFD
jgi:hypothetical protein